MPGLSGVNEKVLAELGELYTEDPKQVCFGKMFFFDCLLSGASWEDFIVCFWHLCVVLWVAVMVLCVKIFDVLLFAFMNLNLFFFMQ